MHILGGFRPGKTLHRICQHLGIEQKLRLQPVDSLCMDEIYYASDRTTYRVAEGKEGLLSIERAFSPVTTGLVNP